MINVNIVVLFILFTYYLLSLPKKIFNCLIGNYAAKNTTMTDITSSKSIVFNDTPFNHLMRNRIYRVLMIASSYDAFLLEEDGRIDEQIFNEYVSLNLRYPPTFSELQVLKKQKRFLK